MASLVLHPSLHLAIFILTEQRKTWECILLQSKQVLVGPTVRFMNNKQTEGKEKRNAYNWLRRTKKRRNKYNWLRKTKKRRNIYNWLRRSRGDCFPPFCLFLLILQLWPLILVNKYSRLSTDGLPLPAQKPYYNFLKLIKGDFFQKHACRYDTVSPTIISSRVYSIWFHANQNCSWRTRNYEKRTCIA